MVVTVVMTTYSPPEPNPRFEYAARALDSLHRRLPTQGKINFVLADDGSLQQGRLLEIGNIFRAVVVSGPHNGIGASLNRALAVVGEGPWMYTTDDWLLTEPLDLALPLWLLTQGYDIVRLGPIHPNLACKTMFQHPHGWWLDVDSKEGYAFATRPFLATPSLVEKIGPFDEGLNAYETERLYSERCAGRILVAAINLAGPWSHIGEYEVGEHTPGELFQMEKAAPTW